MVVAKVDPILIFFVAKVDSGMILRVSKGFSDCRETVVLGGAPRRLSGVRKSESSGFLCCPRVGHDRVLMQSGVFSEVSAAPFCTRTTSLRRRRGFGEQVRRLLEDPRGRGGAQAGVQPGPGLGGDPGCVPQPRLQVRNREKGEEELGNASQAVAVFCAFFFFWGGGASSRRQFVDVRRALFDGIFSNDYYDFSKGSEGVLPSEGVAGVFFVAQEWLSSWWRPRRKRGRREAKPGASDS